MRKINPQYLKNANGKESMVVLSVKDFKAIIEELEDMEDVRLYDEAKKDDDGERILFSEYIKSRELKSRKLKNGELQNV